MTRIPFVDLKRQYAPIMNEILEKTGMTISSCRFIGGEELDAFCRELAHWWGTSGAVGVSSGTLGLYAALKVFGVGPGHEVITTAHTAIPTSEAVTMTGARVVFCDIDPETYVIDPDKITSLINSRTRAIIPVHLYGHPADMDRIMDIARRYDLFVIEDCAQSQGAKYLDGKAGSIGHAGVLSFFPSKNLGCIGDGGAVTAASSDILENIRMFCNHGRREKYDHQFEGTNTRLDNVKAAMLRTALPHLDRWNEMRQMAARWYRERLEGLSEIILPRSDKKCTHVYHLFVIQARDREVLSAKLKEQGVQTGLHYPCSLNLLPAYRYLDKGPGSFPVAEKVCSRVLSLPMFPGITEDEVDVVCNTLKKIYA